ncbi:MAG: DUF445 family protein [Planctomycetes bacterium]|nr:DUF445 family protein [Planctomycetota bacterium]
MQPLQLWLTLPPVAAAIGWFTNFIAVRMIFRPREPIGFGPLKIQGVLPKRKAEFARNIGATVSEHLISPEDIKAVIDDPRVSEKLRQDVAARIDDFIARKIATTPMLGMFLKGSFVESLKATLLDEIEDLLEKGVVTIGEHLDEHLDLHRLVEEKILSFDMDRLEKITLSVAKKELFAIEILGAILGFLVGILQLLVLQLIS